MQQRYNFNYQKMGLLVKIGANPYDTRDTGTKKKQ